MSPYFRLTGAYAPAFFSVRDVPTLYSLVSERFNSRTLLIPAMKTYSRGVDWAALAPAKGRSNLKHAPSPGSDSI